MYGLYLLILQFLRVLPIRSLSCKVVERRSGLSLEGFLCDYFLPGYPVIIADGMAHWPARSKWNDLNYLKKVAGCRTVPVEVIILPIYSKIICEVFSMFLVNAGTFE